VDPAIARALQEADELELITTGRVTGRPHAVRVQFAYRDGIVWLRTGGRPSSADATGVRRGPSRRTSDWLRNLEHEPAARVRIGANDVRVRYVPSADPAADLRRAVDLLRAKYGSEWVGDWYLDTGRIPVRLRLEE